MSDEQNDGVSFGGRMFLYEQPELLTTEDHGGLGITPPEKPFEFARHVRGVPVVMAELSSVQKHYPIVFSEFENPSLVAIVGVHEDLNLFVDDDGQWDRHSYVPSYLRCHPFAFARNEQDQYAVVIDRSSTAISSSPEYPFFAGEALSKPIQERVDFCGQYEAERRKTREFCARVRDLGLLAGQRAAFQAAEGGEEQVLADYVSIDSAKLTGLDKDQLDELHRDGSLSAMFAQLFSLENWNRLLTRHADRKPAGPGH